MTIKMPLAEQSQIRRAIEKLKARIRELDAINVESSIQSIDPIIEATDAKISQTLSEILTVTEWHRFQPNPLRNYGSRSNPFAEFRGPNDYLKRNINRARSNLESIIEVFEERLEDVEVAPKARASQAFGSMVLHPQIELHCAALFRDGHYAQAVENACKVLELMVKSRALKVDASGTALMQTVFSPKQPILKFNDLETESEQSEQQGMMFLYAGVMAAIRNPRAHGLIEDDPEQALEYISFINMLVKALERTKLVLTAA